MTDPAQAQSSDRMTVLETRLAHLEQLVEGLQDSVHRAAERHNRQIADVRAQAQPGAGDEARSVGA